MVVFSWIILGALVFKSISEPYDKNLCVTGMLKLRALETRITTEVFTFVAETSTLWRPVAAAAPDEEPDSQVAGFLPLPTAAPVELLRLINASHLEYEQVRERE